MNKVSTVVQNLEIYKRVCVINNPSKQSCLKKLSSAINNNKHQNLRFELIPLPTTQDVLKKLAE